MRISDWSSDVCSSDLSTVAGLTGQGDPITATVEPCRVLDAQGVPGRLGDVRLDPAGEPRVLEDELARDPLRVGGTAAGKVELDALEGDPPLEPQGVDRPGEAGQLFGRDQQDRKSTRLNSSH